MTIGCVNSVVVDGVLIATICHDQATNPMNDKIRCEMIAACRRAEEDAAISALVITGGEGRSFCAGGDFSEVGNLRGGSDVAAWIRGVVDLYTSILGVTKPTVAAVNGHAIGIGFQLALCCDWRVGAQNCRFDMPELRHGIACSLGAYMLERTIGRSAMTEILFGSGPLEPERCRQVGLINELLPEREVIQSATATAQRLAAWPELTRRRTKAFMNAAFVDGLRGVIDESARIHSAAFAAGTARAHFDNIMRRKAASARAAVEEEAAKAPYAE